MENFKVLGIDSVNLIAALCLAKYKKIIQTVLFHWGIFCKFSCEVWVTCANKLLICSVFARVFNELKQHFNNESKMRSGEYIFCFLIQMLKLLVGGALTIQTFHHIIDTISLHLSKKNKLANIFISFFWQRETRAEKLDLKSGKHFFCIFS